MITEIIMKVVIGLVVLAVVYGCFFTVKQNHLGLVERFGKLSRQSRAGLGFKIPLIEVVRMVSLQVRQLVVEVESITQDKVSVNLDVTIQFGVIEEKAAEAAYKLEDPSAQIQALVFDAVRAQLPTLDLDDTFTSKDEIENAVKAKLAETMQDYGYRIVAALVTDIAPDEKVVHSMNEINASRRLRHAATEKAEAEKTLAIARAEAQAETMRLEGEGIASQRQAIVSGMKGAVEEMRVVLGEGVTSADIMTSILVPQYLEMLEKVGGNGKVIFLNHGPGAVVDLRQQIMSAMHASS